MKIDRIKCIANAAGWVSIALAAVLPSQAVAQGTIALFNGVDLIDWTQVGGAGTFLVEDGVIVGRSAPNTQNSFLVTNALYDNFYLDVEFWIDDPTFNSGIQIRSQSLQSHDGGRLFGYQVEIDPSPRQWTGGLYFEGGSPDRAAGWLDDLSDNMAAREAFLLGQWNSLRIEVVGNHFQTWINDIPAVSYFDSDTETSLTDGVIGLQIHSVGAIVEPKEVRFREIYVTPVEPGSSIDFFHDGTIDQNDYVVFMNSMFVSPLGELPGDLTGDGRVDFLDHRAFQSIFDAANGTGTFQAMVSAVRVPEPQSVVMFTIALVGSTVWQSRSRKDKQRK